jgi:hypothetical protein
MVERLRLDVIAEPGPDEADAVEIVGSLVTAAIRGSRPTS